MVTSQALAGAWTLPAGTGQAIVSGYYIEASERFGEDGSPGKGARLRKSDTSVYVEYGVTDWLTAILRPQLKIVAVEDRFGRRKSYAGQAGIGARLRLWSNERSVFSIQTTGRAEGRVSDAHRLAVGGSALDLRLLYGHSFTLAERPAFVEAQLGYRFRFEEPADEIRADFTIGLDVHEDILLLAQSFNVLSHDPARAILEETRSHKVQLSGVWDLNETWSVQLGIATVAGRDALAERGLISAIWRRF